jgi:hypothetical protein
MNLRQVYNKYGIQCLEAAPHFRTAKITYGGTYHIALPYVQYYKINDALFVSLKNTPIRDIKDNDLYCFPGTNAWACLPYDTPINTNIKNLISLFWQTTFTSYYFANGNLKFSSFGDWDKLTKENPNFITNHKWGYRITIDEMCRHSRYPHFTSNLFRPYHGLTLEKRQKLTRWQFLKRSLQWTY